MDKQKIIEGYSCERCKDQYKTKSSLYPIYISGTGGFENMCKVCMLRYLKEKGFINEKGELTI